MRTGARKASSQPLNEAVADAHPIVRTDQATSQQGEGAQIILSANNAMDLDTQGSQTAHDQRPHASSQHQAGIPEEQHVMGYLSHRFVSCRGPAAQAMQVRPALAQLQDQLTGALSGMVRDTTSLSVLVLGDPGSGKTLLVERAVAAACATHNVEGAPNRVLGVVRLSGLLHLDERAAFMELARQLCSEFGQDFSKTATFDENLAFLRNMLATLHHNLKAVVFVLDYFERFARARGKQQLLYNLFDVLQHSQVQAAVIGVTCAQDVMESMEKRVRSRFSHRRMLLTGITHFELTRKTERTGAPDGVFTEARLSNLCGSAAYIRRNAQVPAAASGGAQAAAPARRGAEADTLPVTFSDTPCGMLQDILSVPSGGPLTCQPQGPAPARRSTAATGSSSGAGGSSGAEAAACPIISAAYVAQYNAAVAAAVSDKQVKVALQQLFVVGVKPRGLMAVARAALDAWQESAEAAAAVQAGALPVMFTPAHLLEGIRTQLPQSYVPQLCDLSVLQLYLVAGMVRLEAKKLATYNFEMVWDECQSYREAKGVLGSFTSGAAWRAFEELVAANIAYWISPGAEAAGRIMRYAGVNLAVTPAHVSEALKCHETCPNQLLKFFNCEA